MDFKSPWSLKFVLLVASVILVGVLCLLYGYWHCQTVYPSVFKVSGFGDQNDSGQSKMHWSNTEHSIRGDLNFGTGFAFPYGGLNWSLEDSLGQGLDLWKYRQIEIELLGTSQPSFVIGLNEFVPGWSQLKDRSSYRPKVSRVWPSDAHSGRLTIGMGDFNVPDWWYVDHPNASHDPDLYATRVCSIALTMSGRPNSKAWIEIRSIQLRGDKRFVYVGWLLVILGCLSLMIWVMRELGRSRKQLRQLQARLDLQEKMKPVPKPEKDWPKIQAKIEELWNDTDLQMQTLVDQTGIPAHRITACIKESTGLHFKVLLNQMRLQKAEKLLLESDEQVAQIALKCGYGNVAHFYRVFKQAYGKNPGDFRAQSKSNPD